MTSRFIRTELLLGEKALARLAGTRVMVVGMGAVGSYATEGLARSGIGHLQLVDFDVAQESNINRQLYALSSTVGKPKVEVARERVLDINPDCTVDAITTFVDDITVCQLLADPPDVIIDAIDSLNSKVALLHAASERRVACIISSMGAATRMDPFSVRADDISKTKHCPLARLVRKRLRRRGIRTGIRCIYSVEEPRQTEVEVEAEEFDRGRPRPPLGSFSCLTGIFGLVAATEAVRMTLESESSSQ
ncbi:MAG: tRNA threonylcarbamoyladenosine dehydratase [Verrucomicrobia bacterium]|nr:tRNA threonylcarbamoyladenosine dehydratase [Verrucomicrobiota bacterium]